MKALWRNTAKIRAVVTLCTLLMLQLGMPDGPNAGCRLFAKTPLHSEQPPRVPCVGFEAGVCSFGFSRVLCACSPSTEDITTPSFSVRQTLLRPLSVLLQEGCVSEGWPRHASTKKGCAEMCALQCCVRSGPEAEGGCENTGVGLRSPLPLVHLFRFA